MNLDTRCVVHKSAGVTGSAEAPAQMDGQVVAMSEHKEDFGSGDRIEWRVGGTVSKGFKDYADGLANSKSLIIEFLDSSGAPAVVV